MYPVGGLCLIAVGVLPPLISGTRYWSGERSLLLPIRALLSLHTPSPPSLAELSYSLCATDHYVRISPQDRQHAAAAHQDRHEKRKLMTFTPIDDTTGKWIINGENVDLSPLDGTPDWVEQLDKTPEAGVPALACLPYSGTVSDPITQVADYTIPGTGERAAFSPSNSAPSQLR